MPSLAGNFNPAAGPLIKVTILSQKQAIQFTDSPSQDAKPIRDIKDYTALIDTGASCTCISAKVIENGDLNPIGKTEMRGSTGAIEVDQFVFAIGFMFGTQQLPSGLVSGALTVFMINGPRFENEGLGFDVLLGRDILCKGSFSMSFDGHYVLSF